MGTMMKSICLNWIRFTSLRELSRRHEGWRLLLQDKQSKSLCVSVAKKSSKQEFKSKHSYLVAHPSQYVDYSPSETTRKTYLPNWIEWGELTHLSTAKKTCVLPLSPRIAVDHWTHWMRSCMSPLNSQAGFLSQPCQPSQPPAPFIPFGARIFMEVLPLAAVAMSCGSISSCGIWNILKERGSTA